MSITIALNINFSSEKSLGHAENSPNCNFQGIWTKLKGENCFLRQSFSEYVKEICEIK